MTKIYSLFKCKVVAHYQRFHYMLKSHRVSSRQYILDKAGMWTSGLCAVHCIGVPMLLSISTFSSWAFLHDERIENVVLMASAGLAMSSLMPSYLRHHQRVLPIVILLFGFLLIGTSRFAVEVNESVFGSSGAALVASAHFLNYRFCKKAHIV